MKIETILLFITVLFLGWVALNKQKECERLYPLIASQNARIELLEANNLNYNDSLELEYLSITNKCKPQ